MPIEKFSALECIQNNTKFIVTILNTKVLKEICFVSRRDEDLEKGFQRSLNVSRAKDIAKYLDLAKGVIPSALILSAQSNANLQFDKKTNKVFFEPNKNSFMVLDGQHRLYGLFLAENTYTIPVIIFNNLNTTDEVNLFIDINSTQKGVPTTLLLDIKNLSGKETKKEDLQRLLFDKLNHDSVLAGLMSPAKSKVGKISRLTFNQATDDLLDNGYFHDKDTETILKGIQNYLQACEIVLINSKSTKAKLTNSSIFKALFSVFNEVVDKCLRVNGDFKVDSIVSILDSISKISFDNYIGTSNATYLRLVSDMRKELNDYNNRYNNINSEDLF